MPQKIVTIYTDGACRGNPGPGGYAAILLYKTVRREITGGFRWTTNNRMELLAVIEALVLLKEPCAVKLYSDSQYVLNALEKGWLEGWKKKGWITSNRTEVQNRDLWERLDAALKGHTPTYVWVKGHAANKENNRCDELAVAAAIGQRKNADAPYEQQNPMPVQ